MWNQYEPGRFWRDDGWFWTLFKVPRIILIFPFMGSHHPSWRIFFRGVPIPPTRCVYQRVSHVFAVSSERFIPAPGAIRAKSYSTRNFSRVVTGGYALLILFGGDWNMNFIFHTLGIMIPTDELIFVRGFKTTNQSRYIIVWRNESQWSFNDSQHAPLMNLYEPFWISMILCGMTLF